MTGSGLDFQDLGEAGIVKNLVAPDLPGHGETAAPAAIDFIRPVSLLKCIQAIAGNSSITRPGALLGYSMGGRIALEWALRFPGIFNCMLLIATSPGFERGPEKEARREQDLEWSRCFRQQTPREAMNRWQAQPVLQPVQQTRAWQKHLDRKFERPVFPYRLPMVAWGQGQWPSPLERLEQLPPTLWLFGEKDPVRERFLDKVTALPQRHRLVTIPNAGHAPHLDQPSKTAEFVSDWLEKESKAEKGLS